MKTVSLFKNMVHAGNLILVNGEYPLCEGLCVKRLEPISEKSNKVLLEIRTATILQKLLDDVNCGEEIVAVSGLFEVEDDLPYSVSGDNMGGFIVTLWRDNR